MPGYLRTFFFLLVLAAVSSGLLSGCVPVVQPVAPGSQTGSGLPDAFYRQARERGVAVLQVDPARSLVTIEVRRAGALAGLGHDHVVASHNLRGYVAPQLGKADLAITLDQLVVDEPALRAEVGFTRQPPADAIEGTRRNMLDKVLEVQRFPLATIHIERSALAAPLRVSISLHGVTHEFDVPAQVEELAGGALLVSGQLELKQSAFGITPYSVLGGALQVQDRLEMRFRIHAGP